MEGQTDPTSAPAGDEEPASGGAATKTDPPADAAGPSPKADTASAKAKKVSPRALKRQQKREQKATKKATGKAAGKPAKDAKSKEPSALREVPEQTWGTWRALHPRQALLTALVIASAAYASGRSLREAAVAGGAMFLVQAILGLLNDAKDEKADRSAAVEGKPVADGNLPAGNATFVALCLAIVAVPVAALNGWVAASALAAYLVLGLLSLTPLRRSVLSWLPWALSFATLPAFLSYGGWGPAAEGSPPTWQITAVAAALGIGVHFALTLAHLVADNKTKTRHLPLRIALRIGAGPLLVITVLYLIAAVAGIVYVASAYGLRQ